MPRQIEKKIKLGKTDSIKAACQVRSLAIQTGKTDTIKAACQQHSPAANPKNK